VYKYQPLLLTGLNITGLNITGLNITGLNITGFNIMVINITGLNIMVINITLIVSKGPLSNKRYSFYKKNWQVFNIRRMAKLTFHP
jgi:hypothetical protein